MRTTIIAITTATTTTTTTTATTTADRADAATTTSRCTPRTRPRRTPAGRTTDPVVVRFDDDTAHRCAVEHAVSALGLASAPSVVWDAEHHLQGHLDVSGRHLVLIAPRTDDHVPRLLGEDEWDAVRRGVA